MDSSRKSRLRQWMFEREITFQAVAERTGVSLQTANRLLNADEIPAHRHEQFLNLGFPAELLPIPLDKKPGPKAREPRFPVSQVQ